MKKRPQIRNLEAKIHEDNLNFAKVSPKLSKCSEVVEDLSEDCFETPKDFQGIKICLEEVTTTLESLDDGLQQPLAQTHNTTVIAMTCEASKSYENSDLVAKSSVQVSKIPATRMGKASEVLIEAVKVASEKNQPVIENLPCGKIDFCEVTIVKDVRNFRIVIVYPLICKT